MSTTVYRAEEDILTACEILSQKSQCSQDSVFTPNGITNDIYNSMDESSGDKDLENIKLYYENQLLRSLLQEQQNDSKKKQEQIDQLHEKISVLLNAFVSKAREQKVQRTCSDRCKEEKKYLERDVIVKSNAYIEVETKFMEMNRYLQEVEEQNKRLLNEISILTEKETIRQLTASQENLAGSGSHPSTPVQQSESFPRVRIFNDKDDNKPNYPNSHSTPQEKPRSRKIRIPIKKGKSFNFEKAAKANAKKI